MDPRPGTPAPLAARAHPMRVARRWLVVVGVAYAVFQLASFQFDRAPSWDEAIYLSQVSPGAEAFNFTATRARGITVLVAPLASTDSLTAIRIGLALLAAAALVGAFLPWVRTIGPAAPAGAAALASTWPVLFYGSEVMPNLWAGLAGVAALGFVTRPLREGSRRDELVAAALLFVAALFRPFDAVVLAAAAVAGALLAGRRSLGTGISLVAGAGLGCVPWLVEMAARYGGVRSALGQAMVVGHVAVPGPWARVVQYLVIADGPPTGPVYDHEVPVAGLLIVAIGAVVVAVGIAEARRSRARGAAALGALAGAGLFVAAYVGLVGGVAVRFLIPAIALASIPAGVGLVALWRRSARIAPRAVLVVLLAAWSVWQLGLAVGVEADAARQRAGLRQVGIRIDSSNAGMRCVVASVVGAPQLGIASGCRGRWIPDGGSVDQVLRTESRRDVPLVFLVLADPLDRSPSGATDRWTVRTPATGPLTVYRVDLGAFEASIAP